MTYLLGGLALFLYGQFLLERTIQRSSRIYIRTFLKLLARHKFTAILFGAILTIGMQSSTIAIITLVDLINLGVLQFGTAIGLVLGSSIGTTIMVQAISFNLAGYAMWFIILGFLLSRLLRYVQGELLIGLGFMFYGIYLMGQGVGLSKEIPLWNPFLIGVGAFTLTLISQSTLGAMAVGITLIREGGLGLVNAIHVILGAHLGAGILPLIYSWRINVGRQLGIANLIYRIIGVLIAFPLIGILAKVSTVLTHSPVRQLANAHTLFTLITVALFIPFIGLYTDFIRRILPRREFIKKLDLPDERKELIRLLNDSIRLWEEDNLKEIDRIERECLSVRKVRDVDTLEVLSGLEKIANIIGTGLVDLARKRIVQGLDFSIEGLGEVLNIHRRIIDEFVKEAVDKEIDSLVSASLRAHIDRMRKGFRETRQTSSLHTDALALLEELHWRVGKLIT